MSKYSDYSRSYSENDSFYVRSLLKPKESEVYFKPILTTNKVPTIPVYDNSDYYNYYKSKQQDSLPKMLKSELNTIANYQELPKKYSK
jgi:hypothetical protein